MSEKRIELRDGPPWGFRTNLGQSDTHPRITRVNPGSGAAELGVREGDILKEINSKPLVHLTNVQVQHLLSSAGPTVTLTLVTPSHQQKRRDTIAPPRKRKTPKTTPTTTPGRTSDAEPRTGGEVQPPIWTPASVPSPTPHRKFKPINFTPPSLSDGEEKFREESSTLPRYQSPTVTLLQKARQGELPKGAHYLQTTSSSSPEESYSSLGHGNETLKYNSEPEFREKPKKVFLPRKSEPPRGIRFSPGRIEDYDPARPTFSPTPAQRPPLKLGSKDLGYESDSTLIIRRRAEQESTPPPPPLSPSQQRQVYVEVQKGGEVPLQGLRKPPPFKHSTGNMTGSERGRSRSPGRGPILRSHSDLQTNRRIRPSGIPVRTLTPNPTSQKLRPSPELASPRKVIQTTHQISLKVQTEKGGPQPPQKKPRPSTLKKTTEKTGPTGQKSKVTKVVKIDVEGRIGDKSPSRHISCLSPTPKKSHPPIKTDQSQQEAPVKGATKKATTCPALAPYLQQTQRVSRSVFLIERSPRIPRPTFTSILRESLRKSPRFLQLHSLYRSLDRLGELEKSTCPFLRMETELDFETWWEGRRRRKEETEIQLLSSILREAQARKEFFYQPTSCTRVRWTRESDSGLRTKQWTIEEIKSSFAHRTPGPPTYPSDLYKTGWRGMSVRELGLNLEVASLSKSKFQFYDPTTRHGWLRRAFSMTSTLSPKERDNIRKQLGDMIQKSGDKEEEKKRGTIGGVVRGRMGHTLSSDPYRPSSATPSWDGALSESAKKAISRSLSQEIQDKGRGGILQRKLPPKKELGLPPKGIERCRSVSPGGMGIGGEERSGSHLNILTKLAAIVLSNDPGFQRALRRELRDEIYSLPKTGREVGRLKGYFQTPSLCSSQPNLSRLHPSSPDAYANWRRSRKPIYDPSSTPNVCQPTLTPHSSPSLQSPPLSGNWRIDPSLHRPVSRYVPPPPPYTQTHYGTYPRGRRGGGVKYAETEVNIHYKTPVRLEEKEWIGEEELRRRQQGAMRDFYQQQRQRKHLQEMEDIQSRRHLDYFIPSQKSPIPLNRYDREEKSPEPKLFARALFNFLPQNLRELRLRKGDLVTIRRKLDSNWLEGEHGGSIGIFPASYVQLLSSPVETGTEGVATVKFNFRAATPIEMTINVGETVHLTRRVDPNWFEGRVGERRKGIFPATYVTVIREPSVHQPENPPPLQTPQSLSWDGVRDDLRIDTRNQPMLYRVLYNYFPSHKDELELRENDTVEVLEFCDDMWCVGISNRTGLFGTFPGNYIERMN